MQSEIIAILSNILGVEAEEITPDLDLFEAALLDSFAIVQLSVELEETFGVVLDLEHLTREEIATPTRIAELVRRLSL